VEGDGELRGRLEAQSPKFQRKIGENVLWIVEGDGATKINTTPFAEERRTRRGETLEKKKHRQIGGLLSKLLQLAL